MPTTFALKMKSELRWITTGKKQKIKQLRDPDHHRQIELKITGIEEEEEEEGNTIIGKVDEIGTKYGVKNGLFRFSPEFSWD